MKEMSKVLSFLVTTDFDFSLISKFGFCSKVNTGGWIIDRKPYETNDLIRDINRSGVDALIVEVEEVPAAVFEGCPGLAVVISMRANPVNVDLQAAKESGVIVIHAPGRNAQSVAELTICLILDLLRNVSMAQADLREGNWGEGKQDPYLQFRGRELSGKKVGLIGFGAIGQAVARLLVGFSTDVIVYDPYQEKQVFSDFGVRSVELNELLTQAEVISIHTPLNEETKDLLGEREISMMGPNTVIVNTARAEIINYDALVNGLEEGIIAGAALDVHYQEPLLPEDRLLSFNNVILTPHIGGATNEVISRGSEQVLAALTSYLNGEIPTKGIILPKNPRLKI